MAKTKYILPVKMGDRLELTVETQGSSGDGICHFEGYTLFIPQGLPGDRVTAEVIKVTPRFGAVRVLERVLPSADRVPAPCPVFPECGGCRLQDLRYEKQMEFKVRVVTDALKHIGKILPPESIETLPAERTYHYRNKGSFAVELKEKKLRIGFYKQGTHEVVDSDRCDILLEPINTVKEWIRNLLEKHRVLIYDETKHKGFFRGMVIRHSEATGQTLIGFITTKGRFPKGFVQDIRDPEFLQRFHITGVVQNLNEQDTNVILGEKNRVLSGENRFTEKLGDLTFHLSLGSFFQVNTFQTEKLYEVLGKWTASCRGKILDAYCGSGGISLWLAKMGKEVIGIEEFPEAVQDAQESAEINRIESCEFLQGTVEQHLDRFSGKGEVETIVVDPPRKGCSETVIQSILKIHPDQIIYVSCNPATLARDLSRLSDYYDIKDICVADMFPQTQHVETAVLLTR